jgi:hypothetical protein
MGDINNGRGDRAGLLLIDGSVGGINNGSGEGSILSGFSEGDTSTGIGEGMLLTDEDERRLECLVLAKKGTLGEEDEATGTRAKDGEEKTREAEVRGMEDIEEEEGSLKEVERERGRTSAPSAVRICDACMLKLVGTLESGLL